MTDWFTLRNSRGWSVRYPPTWRALTERDLRASRPPPDLPGPEDAADVTFLGPLYAVEGGAAQIYVQVRPRSAATTAEEYLRAFLRSDPHRVLVREGPARVGGVEGHEIAFRQTNSLGDKRNVLRQFAAPHGEGLLTLSYQVNAPADGRGPSLLDAVLRTLRVSS